VSFNSLLWRGRAGTVDQSISSDAVAGFNSLFGEGRAGTGQGGSKFAEIYNTAIDRAHAQRLLIGFYQYVADHPIRELIKVATTISKWETEFLAYFETRLTNGRTEGRNRTIKHVKRLGYGYRSTRNYVLKCRYRALRLTSWTTPTNTAAAA
jgi:hypothetical protein